MWSRKLTSINVSNNTALASLRKPLPLCQAPVTSIDSRTVIKRALMNNAQGFILLHNHPSGNPLPSLHDIELTSKLRKACVFIFRFAFQLIIDYIYQEYAKQSPTSIFANIFNYGKNRSKKTCRSFSAPADSVGAANGSQSPERL